ncbi:MAG: type II toxin-antitoxin system RelE/ParE family toxin [Bacteroidetes bacterium]|nr:type II toxin-antitoxin system RelE/ParE family toxin [Bacteroidota bacterium]
MEYQITIKKSAAKELDNLPKKFIILVTQAILNLADNPRPQGCKKLKGQSESLWRIRINDYRVIYQIDDVIRIVDVKSVGHRKDIYD